jgi:hypothetical protein
MEPTMKSFIQFNEANEVQAAATARLKKMKKGSSVSFSSQNDSGKKVSGTYGGLKRMGGRSYAQVHHDTGSTHVPVHQIH